MSDIRIKLAEASAHQLAVFASNVLGIECEPGETREALLAKIKPAYARTTFDLPEEDAQDERKPLTAAEALRTGRQMLMIRIPSTDQVGGKEPVPVSVNGKAMYIPRDEDVPVPSEYVEALRNAKQIAYDHHPERGLINRREVMRHPMQVIG